MVNNINAAAAYYTVTIRKQFPSWDEARGIVYRDIKARSKAEAISKARDRARWAGHTGDSKTSGRSVFSATQQECEIGGDEAGW